MAQSAAARLVGFWGASCAALFGIAYIVAQIFEWLGALGSAGGPESASTPAGLALLLTPSLLLGPAFLVTMAALHAAAPQERKVYGLIAVAFGAIYAALTGMVYFVQLTLVAPRMASGDLGDLTLLAFIPYRSFLFAVDLLGYSFMSMATFAGAFALPTGRWHRAAKAAMIANGLLLPFLAFQMFLPALIWPASLWAITFPASAMLLAALFVSPAPGDA